MIIKPAAVPAEGGDAAVDFTAVGEVLDLAAALVRTRGETGESATGDKRPRIRHAIDRAATLTAHSTPADAEAGEAARRWAVLLAAEHVNLACGRPRRRDQLDEAACGRTVDGFGRTELDVGTIGAVNLAADLLTEAADTARRISNATPVPAAGYGPVTAYRIDGASAEAVDIDDLIRVDHPATAEPINARVREIRIQLDQQARIFTLDLPPTTGPHAAEVTADRGWRGQLHRPVPHLPHPWRHPSSTSR